MKVLKYKSSDPAVYLLEQVLFKLGYTVNVSNYFGRDTDSAVKDFQQKNDLVVDGIVGVKTWSKLLSLERELFNYTDKLLSEKDLINFAQEFDLELATVKAINEIESNGKGFLLSGKAKILFEGHVFWRELVKRNIDPVPYVEENTKHVLYKKWTKKYYVGGEGEYNRLRIAATLEANAIFYESAHAAASWGTFQIMGYHYISLGYQSITSFVEAMQTHEREHLKAFGKFLQVNNLIDYLKNHQWEDFSRAYNGPSFKRNQYDKQLKLLYFKYKNIELR